MRSFRSRFTTRGVYGSRTALAAHVPAVLTTNRCLSSGDNNNSNENRKDESASQNPSSGMPRTAWTLPHDETQKARVVDARKESAHERLTSLFERQQARAQQYGQPGVDATPSPHVWHSEHQQQNAPRTTVYSSEPVRQDRVGGGRGRFAFDEDAPHDGDDVTELVPKRTAANAVAAPSRSTLDLLEQELLDDAFHYFAPVPIVSAAGAMTTAAASSSAAGQQEQEQPLTMPEVTYVPGQQIIPPGYTRYRVDVQYQGADFDGWYKSSTRRLVRRHVHADGSVQTVALNAEEEAAVRRGGGGHGSDTFSGGGGVREDGMGTLYHAKTVLEDALAVALDVPSVSVVASVIPEVGVSVRRLPCHVDIPSDVEMQPRTILQRATLWLQQRRQPLAILSCHRCRNQDFHARHGHGVRRVYCYRILNRVAPPLFDAGFQWHVDRHLDVDRMQRFAQAMEGTRDFGYFADPKMANALRRAATSHAPGGFATSAAIDAHEEPLSLGLRPGEIPPAPKAAIEKGLGQLQRAAALPTFNEYGQTVVNFDAKPRQYFKASTNLPTVRTIDKIQVIRQEDEVLIWFVGQSFLRHQIRHMVSVLKASGHGLWDERELQSAFQNGFEVSRKKFMRERLPPAPVCGLTLWDVEYPREFQDDNVAFVDSGPYEEADISSMH